MGRKHGFTLVEILVVATIIGLLATAGVVSYTQLSKQSRDAKRKADLQQLAAALEMYKSNVGTYPVSGGVWRGTCTSYNQSGTVTDSGASGYIPNLSPTYMQKLPHEPKENAISPSLCYLYLSDGVNYKLLAHLGPEVSIASTDPFYDPSRPTWAFQISSSNTSYTW
jgi:prepilin-type N-terminal cleavage/methylation domain-containing protein